MPRRHSHSDENDQASKRRRKLDKAFGRTRLREYGEMPRPAYEVPQDQLPEQTPPTPGPHGRGRDDLEPGEARRAAMNPLVGAPRPPR